MPDPVVSLAIAAGGLLFGLFGVASLFWARREVRKARAEADQARRRYYATTFERRLSGGGRAIKAALQMPARIRSEGLGGIFSTVEEIAGWAELERPDLRRMAARDGTVTILFSDIENSTATNERLGDRAWVRVLTLHDRIVRAQVEARKGFIVKSQGDGFMVAFSEAADAVECAIGIQRALASDRRLRKNPIQVRIGVHAGTAVERKGDLFGRNVALAARVAGTGRGGQILISDAVAEHIGERKDLALGRPHQVELKGLPGEHTVYHVEWRQTQPL